MRHATVNGLSDLDTAKQRLVAVAMGAQIDPQKLAINAYLNGILTSARVNALCDFVTRHPDDSDPPLFASALLDQMIVAELNKISAQLEDMQRAAPLIQVVGHG
jgi:hypothetical protein